MIMIIITVIINDYDDDTLDDSSPIGYHPHYAGHDDGDDYMMT